MSFFAKVSAIDNPLCIRSLTDNATEVKLVKTGNPDDIGLQYRTKSTSPWKSYTVGRAITLSKKNTCVYFRAADRNETFSKYYKDGYYSFSFSQDVKVSGNIMSLVDSSGTSTEIPSSYYFCNLFANCTTLKGDASELLLPAMTLKEHCYDRMFQKCKKLTKSPTLPASTMTKGCYCMMFSQCFNLQTAPALPATTLAGSCYDRMFQSCTNLTVAPKLPAEILADHCYDNMFWGCTSLQVAPELPADQLKDYCYGHMFEKCTSLKASPVLYATKLAKGCYNHMFSGCINLSTITVGFTDWNTVPYLTAYWVDDMPNSTRGTFICPCTLPEEYEESKIPDNWKYECYEPKSKRIRRYAFDDETETESDMDTDTFNKEEVDDLPYKVLENGQMFIIKGKKKFTISGQEITTER